ncbi:HipA family kinase [Sulfobacillus thermosulfidooxidans]|uniref:HipA family kinase n=1 Tax=Sulfobacillus thermosulfidooxidans TaxID=28034 RepID=UPI0004002CF6|nr:HipA family kinase [Sulfobacillus thermosulfidooxidans]
MSDSRYPLEIVKAAEFIRPQGAGGSKPLLLRLEDGRIVHVKFQHNPQTTRSLCSDLIGTLLGHALGVPVPEVVLVDVSWDQLREMPYLTKYRWQPGLQFGTLYIAEARSLKRTDRIDDLSNWSQLPLCALFESWLYNRDVKFSHILRIPQGPSSQFIIIDHGFIFPGGPLWSIESLRRYRRQFPLPSPLTAIAEDIPYRLTFDSALNKMQSLTSWDLREIVNTVPKQWGLSAERKEAIVEFLTYRQKKLEKVAQHLEWLYNHNKSFKEVVPIKDAPVESPSLSAQEDFDSHPPQKDTDSDLNLNPSQNDESYALTEHNEKALPPSDMNTHNQEHTDEEIIASTPVKGVSTDHGEQESD